MLQNKKTEDGVSSPKQQGKMFQQIPDKRCRKGLRSIRSIQWLMAVAAVVFVLGAAGCGSGSDKEEQATDSDAEEAARDGEADMPTFADLDIDVQELDRDMYAADAVLATYEGGEITGAEFLDYLAVRALLSPVTDFNDQNAHEDYMKLNILDDMKAAEMADADDSWSRDRTAEIWEQLEQFYGEEQLAEALDKLDITEETARDRLQKYHLAQQYFRDNLTDEELTEASVRHILIAVEDEPAQEDADAVDDVSAANDEEGNDEAAEDGESVENEGVEEDAADEENVDNEGVEEDPAAIDDEVTEEDTVGEAVETEEGLSDDEALAVANDLYEQLQDGADFAELAEEHSDDPGSAGNGGMYENILLLEGMWVPEFREAALMQEIDEIGEPIRTDHGYHIVRVEERGITEDEQVIDQLIAQKYGEYVYYALDEEIEQIDLSS